jgi:CRISPR/Cas system-associated exonuclease Cas4 (RecB family)
MIINNEILKASVHCHYKAYLKGQDIQSVKSDFEIIFNKLSELQNQKYFTKKHIQKELKSRLYNKRKQYELNQVHIYTVFKNSNINIELDGICFLKKNKVQPILISPYEKVTKTDRLIITLQSYFIEKEFNFIVDSAKIVFGKQLKETKLKLPSSLKEIRKTLSILTKLKSPPLFYRNNHCQVCEFNKSCDKKLQERDDLYQFNFIMSY